MEMFQKYLKVSIIGSYCHLNITEGDKMHFFCKTILVLLGMVEETHRQYNE